MSATLSDGSIAPTPTDNDEPLWAKALASDECEYWIAGAHDKLKSFAGPEHFCPYPKIQCPPQSTPTKRETCM
jgi:hypothetical protein